MQSLGCRLERCVFTALIPQRYLDVAPRMLLNLKRQFPTPWLKIFYLCITSLLSKSSLIFFLLGFFFLFFFFLELYCCSQRKPHTYKLHFPCTFPAFLETIVLRTVKLSSCNLIGGDYLVSSHQRTCFQQASFFQTFVSSLKMLC